MTTIGQPIVWGTEQDLMPVKYPNGEIVEDYKIRLRPRDIGKVFIKEDGRIVCRALIDRKTHWEAGFILGQNINKRHETTTQP